MVYCFLCFYQKSKKNKDVIPRKSQKPLFWAILGLNWPKFDPKKFFSKFDLHHIEWFIVSHVSTKIQRKIMM